MVVEQGKGETPHLSLLLTFVIFRDTLWLSKEIHATI